MKFYFKFGHELFPLLCREAVRFQTLKQARRKSNRREQLKTKPEFNQFENNYCCGYAIE